MGITTLTTVYKVHNHCRACGLGRPEIPTLKVSTAAGPSSKPQTLIDILDLGVSPLANDFKGDGEERAGWYPLKLRWCPRCTLAQLSVVVDPQIIYAKHYPYVTSHSATMKDHFIRLTDDLTRECKMGCVVEIGSNDGSFLEHLKYQFIACFGIEPAENLAKIANKNGIITRNEFFNDRVAREMNLEGIIPDLIVARHVFCHIDDWSETIHALGVLCGKETVVAIEVPYLENTIANCEWDQIYHEHLSYMTIKAMRYALEGSMLHIHGVRHYPIHGGAIVIMLRRNDSEAPPQEVPEEKIVLNQMLSFSDKAQVMVMELGNKVRNLVDQGRTVVGYGASAKATQWIQACGFTRKHIKFICDETLQKQWKYMPGSDIPVVDPGALTRELPEYAVCFAWNFFSEIRAREAIFADKGGKWIKPVPQLEIV